MDNLRRFLIVFCIMFLLAAAVGGFLLSRNYQNVLGELQEDLTVDTPTYVPGGEIITGESFHKNIFCMVRDDDNPESTLMFVINADSATNSLNFMFVPRELRYSESATQTIGYFGNLPSRYSSDITRQCASKLASFLEIQIDYYISMSTEMFGNLITTFSSEDQGVSFIIPSALNYQDDYSSIYIAKGLQYLKGESAQQFIQFYRTVNNEYNADLAMYYDGTDYKRIDIIQDFFESFITQKFTAAPTDFYRKNFTDLFLPYLNPNKSDTNMTDSVISALSGIFKDLKSANVNYYKLSGNWGYNGESYLQFNDYMKNLQLEEAVSTVRASDILSTHFRVG